MGHWKPQDKIIILKHKLRGLAAECVNEEDILKGATDYELFRNFLIEKFKDKEPLAIKLHKVMACRQKADETVLQYATRMKTTAWGLLSTGGGPGTGEVNTTLKNHTLNATFCLGQLPKIRRPVLSKGPKTLEEAIKFALEEERNEVPSSRQALCVYINGRE